MPGGRSSARGRAVRATTPAGRTAGGRKLAPQLEASCDAHLRKLVPPGLAEDDERDGEFDETSNLDDEDDSGVTDAYGDEIVDEPDDRSDEYLGLPDIVESWTNNILVECAEPALFFVTGPAGVEVFVQRLYEAAPARDRVLTALGAYLVTHLPNLTKFRSRDALVRYAEAQRLTQARFVTWAAQPQQITKDMVSRVLKYNAASVPGVGLIPLSALFVRGSERPADPKVAFVKAFCARRPDSTWRDIRAAVYDEFGVLVSEDQAQRLRARAGASFHARRRRNT